MFPFIILSHLYYQEVGPGIHYTFQSTQTYTKSLCFKRFSFAVIQNVFKDGPLKSTCSLSESIIFQKHV